jgi:hypothetical protein
MAEKDVESGKPTQIPHFKQVTSQHGITPEVEAWNYQGSGTQDDPYVVQWIDNDPRNPMLYSEVKKWSLTMLVAMATLAVAFVSSAYSGGANEVITEFGCSREVFTLGISLFVLGFAIGPLLVRQTPRKRNRIAALTLRFAVGAHERALWPSVPIHRNVRWTHCFQRRRGWSAEHLVFDHHAILRRRYRFFSVDQRRWCDC